MESLDPVLQRNIKFHSALQEFMPLITQEAQDKGIDHGVGFIDIMGQAGRQGFPTDAEMEKAIATIKASLAGKVLRPENKAKPVLRLTFQGCGDSTFSQDRRVKQLQTDLEKYGYRISEESRGKKEIRTFENRGEAEEYLKNSGTLIDGLSLRQQKPDSYEAIYPVTDADRHNIESLRLIVRQGSPFFTSKDQDAIEKTAQMRLQMPAGMSNPLMGDLMPDLRIMPGSVIKKIGDRRWHIDTPARYTATAIVRLATVTKVASDSIGLELLKDNQTSAPNYSISNKMIIDKVKEWDSQYGAQVLDAGRDRFTMKFKSLPSDLSRLCTELFFFCPEMELSNDENGNAAYMREYAKKIRQDKTVSFWWD
jgi:hypothetical protein